MIKLTKSLNILYQVSTHPKIFMKLAKQGFFYEVGKNKVC